MGKVVFHPEDNQRKPHKTEADQMGLVEPFVIEKDADEKLQGRRNILQNANHRQRNLTRGRCEHEKGDTGHYPGAYQQAVRGRPLMKEGARACELNECQIEHSDWKYKGSLESQPVE